MRKRLEGYPRGLYEAAYDDKYKKRNARVACVITTWVPDRLLHKYQLRNMKGDHFDFVENKLDSIKCTLASYEHYRTDIEYDLIIVDNSSDRPGICNIINF